ncbi:double zinc ribbon domain-containing protein [Paraburkholderia oxyphila]|uniref:double zinc ribbon domain-containing protein n=1 Tax=Paraburkholderia oxyphila TaxID=614212 RepID=UPI0012ED4FE4
MQAWNEPLIVLECARWIARRYALHKLRAENRDDERFCKYCGTGRVRICLRCGNALSPIVKFCGECGALVCGPSSPSEPARTRVPAPPPVQYTPHTLLRASWPTGQTTVLRTTGLFRIC